MSTTPLFDAVARRADLGDDAGAPAPGSRDGTGGPTAVAGHALAVDQLALVEAVAGALTRAVVDAVAVEVERIAREGVVRA